ncbi:hypothetical protein N665_0218s0036 [Sinapis alba]|nr:hypothetical protein N665_0218s0036 [Sinapis alba]
MDDEFALRDETIRLLAARVKELEDERNQRENWSFQYDQYQTGRTSRGDAGVGTPLPTGTTPEGDAGVGTPLPTDTTPEDIIGLVGEEPEKRGETETEKEGKTEAEIEADKEGEEGGNKDDEDEPSTLQIMAEAAEKVERAAAEKAVADNKGEEGDAGVGTPLPTGTTPEGDAGVGTPLPTDTTPEDIIGLVGEEPEKGGETETEKEGETEAEIEADKEGEEGGNKDDEDEPSTLQIMAEAAEKVERAAAEKAVADNKGEEGEKEDDGGEMQKRVSKRSYLLRSPFTPN